MLKSPFRSPTDPDPQRPLTEANPAVRERSRPAGLKDIFPAAVYTQSVFTCETVRHFEALLKLLDYAGPKLVFVPLLFSDQDPASFSCIISR